MNRVIDGIDLDGLEWVYRCFSPQLSSRFREAVNNKDIYDQRAIALYARTHHFKSDYGLTSIGLNQGSPAGQLYYNEDYSPGVTVQLYNWKNNDNNSGEIIPYETHHFAPTIDPNLPRDASYPVDIKYGTDYYESYDYIESEGVSYDYGVFGGVGSSLNQGYLNGWGFMQFSSDLKQAMFGAGAGADFTIRSRGSYIGYDFPNLENFAGDGKFAGFDVDIFVASVGAQLWKSLGDGPNGISWKGHIITGGGGVGVKLFETGNSKTNIIFPNSPVGKSITPDMWGVNTVRNFEPIIYEQE